MLHSLGSLEAISDFCVSSMYGRNLFWARLDQIVRSMSWCSSRGKLSTARSSRSTAKKAGRD